MHIIIAQYNTILSIHFLIANLIYDYLRELQVVVEHFLEEN